MLVASTFQSSKGDSSGYSQAPFEERNQTPKQPLAYQSRLLDPPSPRAGAASSQSLYGSTSPLDGRLSNFLSSSADYSSKTSPNPLTSSRDYDASSQSGRIKGYDASKTENPAEPHKLQSSSDSFAAKYGIGNTSKNARNPSMERDSIADKYGLGTKSNNARSPSMERDDLAGKYGLGNTSNNTRSPSMERDKLAGKYGLGNTSNNARSPSMERLASDRYSTEKGISNGARSPHVGSRSPNTTRSSIEGKTSSKEPHRSSLDELRNRLAASNSSAPKNTDERTISSPPTTRSNRPSHKVLQEATSMTGKTENPPPNSIQAATANKLNVFNYGGGDRSGSNNQLHMMMNHNMLSAHREASDTSKKKNSKKNRRKITVNLANTRYEIVREVVQDLGYSITKDEDTTAYLLWNDSFVSTDRISDLKSFQRVNHFPGMGEICRKDCLARNMTKMMKAHPEEFDFVPRTWILPQDYNNLQNYYKDMKKRKKFKCFIAKPSNGAMGNGISLYHNAEKIPPSEHYVVQEYMDKPFLIDGYKCDLRIYVLMLSCDPLRLFLFNDGLVRMSTEQYKEPSPQNLDVLFMHLTNYSINKHSEGYEKGGNTHTGSKRSLKFLNDALRQNGADVAGLWNNITDIIIKTMICAMPHVNHAYKMCRPGQPPNSDSVCFEILGFDILLDRKLKPWLVEINRSPSFGTNEDIDYMIKSALVKDTLKLVNIRVSDKRKNIAAQKAAAQRRLLQPRAGIDIEDKRKKMGQDKRKTELRDLLNKIRRDNERSEFEDRNSGRFRRIFPPDDRHKQERYARLMLTGFSTLVTGLGKTGAMARDIERQYIKKYREDEILDMLAQYESEEVQQEGKRRQFGPAPLTAMPSSLTNGKQKPADSDGEESDSDSSEDESPKPRSRQLSRPRPKSSGIIRPQRCGSAVRSGRTRDLKFSLSEDTDAVNRAIKEKEDELVQLVKGALHDMKIKFPGKSDQEAEEVLSKLAENWKNHKPRVASYWLVKLDSIKRRKVVDIVRSNVKAKIQHIYQSGDVESLRVYRIFSRVFNRLLWSHGQGLWNCFTAPGNSWETIFSKSTDVINPSEMECCRRIVKLCKDCLLIVYQFASEARGKQQNPQQPISQDDETISSRVEIPKTPTQITAKPPKIIGQTNGIAHPSWKPNMSTLSNKYSQLYTNTAVGFRS